VSERGLLLLGLLLTQAAVIVLAAIVDASSPWPWALTELALVGALAAMLATGSRGAERNQKAFRSLVDSLEEGVVMVDATGRIVAANPSSQRILGMDPARVLDDEFVGDDGEHPLRVTAATGRPQRGVTLGLSRPDGTTRCLSVSTRAVEPGRDGPHAVVVSFTDVTEEREATDALARSNAELEQFAYVASHDLSEPLRMVSSYLNLLRRRYRGRLDQDADEFIEFAVDGAGRMRGLIEALLAYSRAGAGETEYERVELGSVAGNVLRSLAARLVEAGAEIEVGDLPAVLGDRSQLEQLLQNLVANALKFREGERARVWVRAEDSGGPMALIAVADGGIGIPAERREQVFEMFGRLHDRESYEGTGIGLAVCRKIVERHGGRIWIDEREGGGTVFRFTLPVA
jgi:PAS domain S-box-containing protein